MLVLLEQTREEEAEEEEAEEAEEAEEEAAGVSYKTTHVREQVKQTHACGPRAGLTFVLRLPN